uniref:ATP synthase F0 subunit 8 n=1 Tax=Melicertum octocostatum TaxID=323307 RepID=A0A0S2IAG1_9CNID|nr:ATP synthase F0 subunit 8 [Melicertum octocostatum]
MSQLDVSISFSHLCGLIICFYVFIHYVTIILIQFWYNQKLRSLSEEELMIQLEKLDNTVVLKRILKL